MVLPNFELKHFPDSTFTPCRGFLGDIFCSSFCFFLTLVRLGSLHNKSLFVMTVNHDQIQLSLDPLFLLSLPSSFFRVGNKHSIYWNRKLLTPVVCFAELVWTFFYKEDRLAKLQKSDFQSHFSTSKIVQIFTKKKFIEEYQFRTTTFAKIIFW